MTRLTIYQKPTCSTCREVMERLKDAGIDPTSLREYDIRGIVGKTLSTDDAFAIGRCFGSVVARAGGKTTRRLRHRTLSVGDRAGHHLPGDAPRTGRDLARGGLGPLTPEEVGAFAANAFIGAESLYLLGLEKKGLPVRQALRRIGDLVRSAEAGSSKR